MTENTILVLPVLILSFQMHELDLPRVILYGTLGHVFAHELSHAIDGSLKTNLVYQNIDNLAR